MRAVAAILVFVIAGASAAHLAKPIRQETPDIAWPKEYHFNAEDIDLSSSVVKTYEMWYSESQNKSRIDLYDGTIKRYYYGPEEESDDEFSAGHIYMFHPESNEEEEGVIKCEKMHNYYGDILDFLPELDEFDYAGTTKLGKQELELFSKDEVRGEKLRTEETLLVINKDGVGVPFQHIKKVFTLTSGALMSHNIINYYNYDENVGSEELTADENKCKSWAFGLDEAIDRLHPSVPSDVDFIFNSFKTHHKKEYEEKEHEYRKAVFQKNWNRIVEHNKKNLGYKLGVNRFTDHTLEELNYLAATKFTDPIRGTEPFPHTLEEVNKMAENQQLPETFDLRDEGVVSPVRNQAECGSCWAFAATATMEAALARNNGGKVLDLSEQSLVDCAWQYRSHGCQGAEGIGTVFDYLVDYGIPTVEEYGPYLMEDGLCHVKNMSTTFKAKGYVAVTPNSPNALKAALYKYGPITIGVEVTDAMVAYSSGIFYDFECEPGTMNHAVMLVGYGHNYGELYWIIKNSWGQEWGENGYLRIAAKDNICNVMTSPVYPLVE